MTEPISPSPRFVVLCLVSAALACSKAHPPAARGAACGADQSCQSGLVCTDAPAGLPASPGHPTCAAPSRHYTFRAIAGVSMGAIGASRIAAAHPELFDALGALGGPLDATNLLATIETEHMGGFCPSAQLEAALALDLADGGNRLDRPGGVAGCTPAPAPAPARYTQAQRFNHWAFTTNGGHFDRDTYLDIFRDLTLALGNPLSANPNSNALAAPLTPAQYAAATCAQPFVVEHAVDARYSPHGEHRAITFCDGEAPVVLCADLALVDWCAAAALNGRHLAQRSDADAFCAANNHGGGAHDADENSPVQAEQDAYFANHGAQPGCWAGSKMVPFALALDLNGNGRRDWHEPLLVQAHEPFSDVGKDGCPDPLEDGHGGCTTADKSPYLTGVKDPNGDNFDAQANPAGTENNLRYDEGEPFLDVGLDGVAGTSDYGEGDGKFTVAPGYANWLASDLRLRLLAMPDAQRRNLDLYLEGGVRDVFDLGGQALAVSSAATATEADGLRTFFDFVQIPPAGRSAWPGGTFDPFTFDVAALGRNTLLLYGTPDATPGQIRAGDGNHVGTPVQLVNRFITYARWLSRRWDPISPARTVLGDGRIIPSLHYPSAVLGAEWNYGVSLPPGYDDPANADRRYPVMALMHGYGQSAEDMSGTGAVFNISTNTGLSRELIIVFPSGKCCLNGPHGERACRDTDDNGVSYESQGYVRECARGSFYQDRQGLTSADQARYADAVLELFSVIDANYRTLGPIDGPAF